MSQLESLIATAGEAPLLQALDYSLAPSSTAIISRRTHLRAYPTSASTFTPTGTKICRIRLGGDDYVDASTVRLQFTINNLDASNKLVPLTGAWGVWQQVYLRSGGTEIDSIPYYNRYHSQYMFNHATQAEQWGWMGIEGGMSTVAVSGGGTFRPQPGTIPAAKSLTVMHPLALSLFSSGKILPTRFAPLELECSLISTVSDWLDATSGNNTSFSISDVQLLYDGVMLDEAITNSLMKALLNNRVLSLPVMNAYQVIQPIPAGSTSYNFTTARAFSRVASVWLTFRKTGARSNSFIVPGDLPGAGVTTDLENGTCPTARLSIGPHLWPAPSPISSCAEYFHQFQSALGHVPNITRLDYETNSFTMVFDLKRLPSDATTSISTRSGDQIRCDLINLTADAATEVWVTLICFNTCCIRESGVTLLT